MIRFQLRHLRVNVYNLLTETMFVVMSITARALLRLLIDKMLNEQPEADEGKTHIPPPRISETVKIETKITRWVIGSSSLLRPVVLKTADL